jgi:uncharacterized protein (TIGR02300 family)
MPAKDLGTKYVCFKCAAKFYDLKKPDPICPKCGADQREAAASKPSEGRRSRLSSVPKIVEAIEPAAAEAEEGAEDEDEEVEVEEEVAEEDP